jgi:hypothetical protein
VAVAAPLMAVILTTKTQSIMMPGMRTTLTLDPDVAKLLEDAVHRTRRPLKFVVNDALRRGLASFPRAAARRRFRVEPHRSALRPGFDLAGFNKLADELEDEAIIAKARRRH